MRVRVFLYRRHTVIQTAWQHILLISQIHSCYCCHCQVVWRGGGGNVSPPLPLCVPNFLIRSGFCRASAVYPASARTLSIGADKKCLLGVFWHCWCKNRTTRSKDFLRSRPRRIKCTRGGIRRVDQTLRRELNPTGKQQQ